MIISPSIVNIVHMHNMVSMLSISILLAFAVLLLSSFARATSRSPAGGPPDPGRLRRQGPRWPRAPGRSSPAALLFNRKSCLCLIASYVIISSIIVAVLLFFPCPLFFPDWGRLLIRCVDGNLQDNATKHRGIRAIASQQLILLWSWHPPHLLLCRERERERESDHSSYMYIICTPYTWSTPSDRSPAKAPQGPRSRRSRRRLCDQNQTISIYYCDLIYYEYLLPSDNILYYTIQSPNNIYYEYVQYCDLIYYSICVDAARRAPAAAGAMRFVAASVSGALA